MNLPSEVGDLVRMELSAGISDDELRIFCIPEYDDVCKGSFAEITVKCVTTGAKAGPFVTELRTFPDGHLYAAFKRPPGMYAGDIVYMRLRALNILDWFDEEACRPLTAVPSAVSAEALPAAPEEITYGGDFVPADQLIKTDFSWHEYASKKVFPDQPDVVLIEEAVAAELAEEPAPVVCPLNEVKNGSGKLLELPRIVGPYNKELAEAARTAVKKYLQQHERARSVNIINGLPDLAKARIYEALKSLEKKEIIRRSPESVPGNPIWELVA